MIEAIVAAGLTLALVVGPLVWRVLKDRRDEAALQVQAQVQATANRAFGGESLLTVAVAAPSLRHPGQVRLSAPAGWECLIERAWPRVMKKVPANYELVIESRPPAFTVAREHARAVGVAA